MLSVFALSWWQCGQLSVSLHRCDVALSPPVKRRHVFSIRRRGLAAPTGTPGHLHPLPGPQPPSHRALVQPRHPGFVHLIVRLLHLVPPGREVLHEHRRTRSPERQRRRYRSGRPDGTHPARSVTHRSSLTHRFCLIRRFVCVLLLETLCSHVSRHVLVPVCQTSWFLKWAVCYADVSKCASIYFPPSWQVQRFTENFNSSLAN